jgi:hypothetical protein
MTKFLIGMATAALWFALSHAANAERICREVCDDGSCVSRCVSRPDSEVIVHERQQPRYHHRGFDVDTPAGDLEFRR